VLYRQNLTASDTGSVWEYWPGKANRGARRTLDLTRPGWLPASSPRLAGNNAHVWSDVNDDDPAQASEEVTPGANSTTGPTRAEAASPACRTVATSTTPT